METNSKTFESANLPKIYKYYRGPIAATDHTSFNNATFRSLNFSSIFAVPKTQVDVYKYITK